MGGRRRRAELILTAPHLEQVVQAWLPDRCQSLAAELSISFAALFWRLPLQLLHFGAKPLFALVANLLVAPLLAPLTMLAMLSVMLILVGPTAVVPLLLWPIHQLVALVITLASWISHWLGAQLLTGRTQVGGCLVCTGFAALVSGGRVLPPVLVGDPPDSRLAPPRPGAVR